MAMVEGITIRRATVNDADVIVDFNSRIAWETEGKQLLPEIISAGVQALLANPTLGFYLVAEMNGEVVGALMITTEWSDWRNGIFWWIQSVYVRPDYRRRGIYRQLYQSVKDRAADDATVCGFRLYVERENSSAQQTYRALGMQETAYLLFEEIMP